MQIELEELQPLLVVSAKETMDMMVTIEKESAAVAVTTAKVQEEEAIANQAAAEANELKEECERDLSKALPALEGALAALDTLKVKNWLG